jgi:hypothetical protein
VLRGSAAGHPNEYIATIPTPDSILNKFPPVVYTAKGNDLIYKDTLVKSFPDFAEEQKRVLLEELSKHNWKL